MNLVELSESPRTQFGKVAFEEQSEPQKVFTAVYAFTGAVSWDGFLGFFAHWFETANFIVEALEIVGAYHAASTVENAIKIAFPGGLPFKFDPPVGQVWAPDDTFPNDVTEALWVLDQEFYKCPDDVFDLLLKYVMKHPEEFGEV